MNITMPLVTIEKIKSGVYSPTAFEVEGAVYVGKPGMPSGFKSEYRGSSTEDFDTFRDVGLIYPADYLEWYQSITALAEKYSTGVGRMNAGGYEGYGYEDYIVRAGELLVSLSLPILKTTGYKFAWWIKHLEIDIPGNQGGNYADVWILLADATLEYLGRVNGEPYGFSSVAKAQEWIDINLKRDTENRPKTGAALKRKMDGMKKYLNKVTAGIARTATRPFADEYKRPIVLAALYLEVQEINRRMALEQSGNF